MKVEDKFAPLSRFLVIAAAVVFILWGISQAQAVLVSFLVAVYLAMLATPPLLWLERKRVPGLVAVAIVVSVTVLLLLAMAAAVGTSINSFVAAVPEYQARLQEQVAGFREFLARTHLASPASTLPEYLDPAAVMNLTASLFLGMGSTFSRIFLILLTFTLILLEATSFPIKLRAVLGDPLQVFPRFTRILADMKRYMLLKTAISLATGLLVGLGLAALGVDFPVLWGFLAFALNYVPSLGSLLAAVPAVLLTLLQLGIWRAVLAVAGYLAINLVIGVVVETRLMGRKLGLSPLVVFLSLLFWASILGPIGAVLCIPLTMALKFGFESSESTRWIGVLLGPADPLPRAPVVDSAAGALGPLVGDMPASQR